ncbi:MAG: glycosyltransferase family 9 protein [Planctomycetes bacterium]|nr:glycosyltransferase family 9 protein [Planctomycetota bacterium]
MMHALPQRDFRRILFVRLSAVGDVINTLPALSALRTRFPTAFIGFLAEDRVRDLVLNHPCVDRVHLFPRRRWADMARRPWQWTPLLREISRFVSDLRAQRYDVALDLQANLKGAIHAVASGARLRIGFGPGHTREFNHVFSHVHVTPPTMVLNRVDKFLAMVSALGAPIQNAVYQLPPSEAARERVRVFLCENGLAPRSFIAIHPGTSDFGRAKRWLPERFGQVAERVAQTHGLRSVVTWGPGERELAERVAAESGGHAVAAMETRSLLELAEILRHARLFVGCDSGPLHLSSAVGVPSVALFGPKNPRVYGPVNPHARVVYKPNGNGSPMTAITVDEVCESVRDLLHCSA